jgi:hypothetical protein
VRLKHLPEPAAPSSWVRTAESLARGEHRDEVRTEAHCCTVFLASALLALLCSSTLLAQATRNDGLLCIALSILQILLVGSVSAVDYDGALPVFMQLLNHHLWTLRIQHKARSLQKQEHAVSPAFLLGQEGHPYPPVSPTSTSHFAVNSKRSPKSSSKSPTHAKRHLAAADTPPLPIYVRGLCTIVRTGEHSIQLY